MPTNDEIFDAMVAYSEIVQKGLDERWELLPLDLYDSETYEVIGGLLARQATLSCDLALNPNIWTGHIAPLILRCMTDCHITLAWILKAPQERAKQYILYGLGQEKLQIEHLESEGDKSDERISQMISMKKAWLNSQRFDFLTEVNVGNWSGLNTREMATEAGCEGLYKFAYTPLSGVAHNMWQHISVYNLKTCKNPLHKFHRAPFTLEHPLEPDFVYRSAKYLNRSFEVVDSTYDFQCQAEMPLDFFCSEMDKLQSSDEHGE